MHRRRTPWALAFALGLLFACTPPPTDKCPRWLGRPRAPTITPAPAFTVTSSPRTPSNWSRRGEHLSQRYSPLDQINTTNVGPEGPGGRTYGSGNAAKYSHEATPIVYKGSCTSPRATTTSSRSTRRPASTCGSTSRDRQNINTICCGWDAAASRIGDGMVYSAQLDGLARRARPDDRQDGVEGPNVLLAGGLHDDDPRRPYYNGLVIVGMTGGEFGARGSMTAYDAETGEARVALLHVPAAGRDRRRHVAGLGEWQTCGATVWGYAVDRPEHGHRVLHDLERRPVDGPRRRATNLFSSSMVAVNASTRASTGGTSRGAPRHLGLRLPVADRSCSTSR